MGKKDSAVEKRQQNEFFQQKELEIAIQCELSELWQQAHGVEDVIAKTNRILQGYLAPAGNAVCLYDHQAGTFEIAAAVALDAQLGDKMLLHLLKAWEKGLDDPKEKKLLTVHHHGASYRVFVSFMIGGEGLLGAVVAWQPAANFSRARAARWWRYLGMIATQCTAVLQFLGSFGRLSSRKVVDLPELYHDAEHVTSHTGAKRVLIPIIDMICDTFDYDTCSLFLLDAAGKQLIREALRPAPQDTETVVAIEIEEDPLIHDLVRGGRAILINDVNQSSNATGLRMYQPSIRSFMAVCMVIEGQVQGTINLTNSTPNVYTEDDLRLLAIIANQAALIYNTARSLLRLEAVLTNVIASVPVGIVAFDHSRKEVLANHAAERIMELDHTLTHQYDALLTKVEEFNYHLPLASDQKDTPPSEAGLIDHEGTVIKTRVSALRDGAGGDIGDVVILEDVSAEQAMQEQLQRAERMVALGELSAGIAHEIKNPLTSIKGFTQLLPSKYGNDAFREKFIRVISNEVNRLNTIVEGMLNFAHPKVRRFVSCDVNAVLERMFLLVEHKCRKQGIAVVRELDEQVNAYADPDGMEQVFLNIAMNAIEVMPAGGTLTVAAGMTRGGTCAEVRFCDTGPGISPKIMGKIYNPFFTTKNEGTGLGLSISYRIVDEHHGRMTVASEPGVGTTFVITVPAVREGAHEDQNPCR